MHVFSICFLLKALPCTGSDAYQEAPAGSRRPQEAPAGSRRLREAPGGSRRPQEAPGGSRRLQEAPAGFRRPLEVLKRPQKASRGPGSASGDPIMLLGHAGNLSPHYKNSPHELQ